MNMGTGGMVRWLRILAALPEDLSLDSSTHAGQPRTIAYNSSSGGSDTLFWIPQAPPSHTWHTQTQAYSQIIKVYV